ncbi:phosphatidylinositol glycan, class O [Babesia microti strain RI]|uniref:Phosphatidylinositol glycan, class O n=1 Tax=Babesia microti (strain RI) TaxID=1133968 RepID=A0A1R4A9Z8_BABMR|nr:phosphatidylinositol glycan, class O [Babesia microti strain RI]SJK85795.1 phosphatidylinositol glycan, class O [Babesia microti strain RI]|eukprot:XP_021338017.1 phosphatidylinositol glycan, class O [Babesia microti strain RI]
MCQLLNMYDINTPRAYHFHVNKRFMMRWKEILWSNTSILVYLLILYIFSYSFKLKKPPSHSISNATIPAPYLFTEFTFYYKQNSNLSTIPYHDTLELSRWIEYRPYKRVILVLLDAIRFDYVIHDPMVDTNEPRRVYTNQMNNLTRIFQEVGNKGRLFRLKAEIPTTTIARIKSIITGHSQAYLDIADNNNPQSLEADNILKQLLLQDRKVVIMGDSLWDSLQKGVATRSYTASGLNIHDNTADVKVFTHFFDEFNKSDWDVLIGHLVGIDHFGHVHGIDNASISNMLRSYDNFVASIIENVLTKQYQDTLLVILSDHGVNADGTHGGKAPEEVDAFMAAFNYKGFAETDQAIEHLLLCREKNFLQGYRQKHNVLNGKIKGDIFHWASQNDIAPTLAVLLGCPIPYNSTGRVLYELTPANPPILTLSDSPGMDYVNKLISKQRYYSQICHINLHSLLRNYLQTQSKGEYNDNDGLHMDSINRKKSIIMHNLFILNKLRHILLLFADPSSVTAKNAEFHIKSMKSHLLLCQEITSELSDSFLDSREKIDFWTMLPLFLLLTLSIVELIDWQILCEILSKIRLKILLTCTTMFACSLLLRNFMEYSDITHNIYICLPASIVISTFFHIIWNYFNMPLIDFSAPTFSSAVNLVNGFYIPELVAIIFHLLTPFMESLAVLAPSCYMSLVVYLIVNNLLPLEDWDYRLEKFAEAKNKSPTFLHLLKRSGFLLKPFSICMLMKVLYWGKNFKYFSSFRWWCKIAHIHPIPLLSLSLIYQLFKINPLISLYDLKIEWAVWTTQAALTSFCLSYNHGEMISLSYLFAKIVFITTVTMIIFELLRPLVYGSNKKPSISRTSYRLQTISVHLLWPAYLLYGPLQSLNVLLSIVTEKLYFEVLKYTITKSQKYNVSLIRFAIVYIFLGEHFYYSTEHTNSFFTLPFDAAYTLTGSYTRFISELLIGYHIFFFSFLSAIQFIMTLNNYKAHLIFCKQLNSSITLATVVSRLSFGVYFYTLCSALILTLMKSHRLFYSTFFPSTVFTVCRTSIFLLATRLLFNLIVLSSNDDEQV